METNTRNKKQRAEERLKALKAFYTHLTIYLLVNTFITLVKMYHHMNNGATIFEAIWNFETFVVWFFWGIGLAGHAVKVFSFNPFFSKDWEKRQIEKYMNEELTEAEKYKKLGDDRS